MEVTLTSRAEELLRELAHLGPPEQIVEMALEQMLADEPTAKNQVSAREAVERIRELRKGNTLGGLSVKDLINEGRKY
ncbi:MAG: hypothetical protein ACJ746_25215 [Bryobacteraceae bacterium]